MRLIRTGRLLFILVMLPSCALVPGLDLSVDRTLEGAPTESGGFDLIHVDATIAGKLSKRQSYGAVSGIAPSKAADSEYRIGAGDVLSIIVWDHPELTNPTGEFRDPESSGRLVGPSGRIFYPYVGELEVAGLTSSEVRRLISARLARVVREPQVDVRIVAYRSQKIKVTGEVKNPSVLSITEQPLTVLEALTESGGLTERAVRNHVVLTRNQKDYTLPLHTQRGGWAENFELENGDTLYVPPSDAQSAYVLGAVESQTKLPLPYGSMSLAEALSLVGGLDGQKADSQRVFIIRSEKLAQVVSNKRALVYVVDMSKVNSLILADHFELQPRDIVYVDRTALSSYNTVVSQILPSITTLFQLDLLIDSN